MAGDQSVGDASDEDEAVSPNDRPTQAVDVALADDTASLDPDHPINARLRDNGIGLVPRVIMVATRDKFASLGAAAIESVFRVPFGWHVIDDGKRTLVFDPGGSVQINLDLRAATPDALLITSPGRWRRTTQKRNFSSSTSWARRVWRCVISKSTGVGSIRRI